MPQVIVSTTTTLDGYLDDTTANRLILSSDEDLQAVHRLRARVGAIIIGAETLRKDSPRLDIRYADIQPNPPPAKVVITGSGNINPDSRFFTEGSGKKFVFCLPETPSENLDRLSAVATIVPCHPHITANTILKYLTSIGLMRVMVEGGAVVQEMFFAEGCVDILRLGRAPLLLGKSGGARFMPSGTFPPSTLTTLSIEKLGSTAVTWYQVKSDAHYLRRAATLAEHSPEPDSGHAAGIIILNKYGVEICGTLGELFPAQNALEVALMKAQNLNIDTDRATVFASSGQLLHSYTSLESLSSLLIRNGIARLVIPTIQDVDTEALKDLLVRLDTDGVTVQWCDINKLNSQSRLNNA